MKKFEWTNELQEKLDAIPKNATIKEVSETLRIPFHIARRKVEERRGKVYNRLEDESLAEFIALAPSMSVADLALRFKKSKAMIAKLKKQYGIKSDGTTTRIRRTLDDSTVRLIRMYDGSPNQFKEDYGIEISLSVFYKVKNMKLYKDVL